MLIPYSSLTQLPEETLNNLIREYILGQVEDGSFESLSNEAMQLAIQRSKQALAQGELVVEYGEEEESIAIRKRQDVVGFEE